ncbi:MAG: DM13 domain-containing protein [Cyanobacteria bacterium P01_G01_bin.49]
MKLNHVATSLITPVLILSTVGISFVETTSVLAGNNIFSNKEAIAQVKEITRSGSFVTTEQDHPTAGKATIIKEGEKHYLEFDKDFTTADGPDVQVILYRGNEVPVNLSEEDYMSLAPLQEFSGTQRYEIPDDVNLDDYQAVGIWCREFNVTFGYASL